jgi:hypothetical protein
MLFRDYRNEFNYKFPNEDIKNLIENMDIESYTKLPKEFLEWLYEI